MKNGKITTYDKKAIKYKLHLLTGLRPGYFMPEPLVIYTFGVTRKRRLTKAVFL